MGRRQRRSGLPVASIESPPPSARPAWQLRLLSIGTSLCALVLVDLGLRLTGLTPAPDPSVLYEQSFARGFSPLVDDGPEHWTIRPDWINRSEQLAFAPGQQPGRVFLQPGFRPARILRHKPADVLRVVALGASSTFGLYVHAEQAFPQLTAELIQATRPGTRVEPINLGCPGWASDRIANLMPTVLALEPDLVVFYEGHNELLARLADAGPATPGHRLAARLLRVSSLFAWAWRAGRMWNTRGTRLLDEDAAALAAGQVPVFDPLRLPPGDVQQVAEAEWTRAASRFRRNLERIADACQTAKVPVVFVLPAVNLMFPPALSAHAAGFQEHQAFEQAQSQAQRAFEHGDLGQALLQLDRAIALSPRFAMVHYWRGLMLASANRSEEARVAFQLANDYDARTHRLTSPIERALIDAAGARRVPWVDLRPIFEARLDVEASRRMFVDFCHPTRAGHAAIAGAIAPLAVSLLDERSRAAPTPIP